jgi:cysteine desulfurase
MPRKEDARRAGTQNVAGAAALVAGLQDRQTRSSEASSKSRLRLDVEDSLKEGVPGIQIVAEEADRLWNTISLLLPELRDCRRRWVVRLDAAGLATSSGSACSSGKEAPSHVLRTMGLEAVADRIVRLSSGWDTSAAEWMHAVSIIQKVYAEETPLE